MPLISIRHPTRDTFERVGAMLILTTALLLAATTVATASPHSYRAKHSAQTLTESDRVLNAVFDDLLSYRGKDSPIFHARIPKAKPVFYTINSDYGLWTTEDFEHRPAGWPQQSWKGVLKLAQHFIGRNKSPISLVGLRAGRREIVLQRAPASFALGRPIEATLLGYSKDHGTSLVVIMIPWGMHHATGFYLLRQGPKGGWKVARRGFLYFP